MANKRVKKTSEKKESTSFLAYIPFIVLVAVIIAFVTLPYISSKPSLPVVEVNQFEKISNHGFTNNVQIYFITWYKSPDGATDSWVIYTALRHYGTFNVTPTYSVYDQYIGNATPGLIFNSFTPNTSDIYFKAIYVYGDNYNETINGTAIPQGEYLNYALAVIKAQAPSWVYNIILKYIVNGVVAYGKEAVEGISPANYTGVTRMPTVLIISGPKGVWLLLGYPEQFTPTYLTLVVKETPSQLLENIDEDKIPDPLNTTASTLLQIINMVN